MLRPPQGRQLLDRPGWMDWLIVGDFPPLFQEFRLKRWVLLWGQPRRFSRRYNGCANPRPVVMNTNANIFSGFTPVEWESRVWDGKLVEESND
jgi:hypothetical protein